MVLHQLVLTQKQEDSLQTRDTLCLQQTKIQMHMHTCACVYTHARSLGKWHVEVSV